MQKLFAYLLTVLLLIALLAGCSLKKGASPVNEPWKNGKTLKPTKLTFLIPAKEHERFPVIKEELEKRAKTQLNVELEFIFTDSSYVFYQDLLELKLSSDDEIDAFVVFDSNLGNLVRNGMVADITDLFSKYAPSYSSAFTGEQLAVAVFDGRLMAVPQCRLPEMKRLYAVVRDDLLKKYGISEIKSFGDFEKFLDKVRQNEERILPLLTYNTTLSLFAEYYGYVVFDESYGLVYKWDDPDMKLMAWEQTPEYEEAVTTLNRWKKKGFLNEGITNQPIYIETEITGGGYASFIRPYGTAEYYNTLLEKEGYVSWRYREFDLYPGKKSQRITSSGPMLAFNRNSPDVERALMFLEWIETNRDVYELIMYGIRGQDFEGDIHNTPGRPESLSTDNPYAQWNGKSFFYNYHNEGLDPEDVKNYLNVINERSDIVPHHGFHIDHQALYNLIGSFDVKRNTFYLEQIIDKGTYVKEELQKHIKNQSGITRYILVEMQRQLDAWRNKIKKAD